MKSALEAKFAMILRALGLNPVREYKFCPTRRWRFDFALPDRKIAWEVEGGVWQGGRHTRGKGFTNDCEKLNWAASDGWIVLRYPSVLFHKVGEDYARLTKKEI